MDNCIINLEDLDLQQIVADRDEIRRYNAQRDEMEQLDAVVFADQRRGICVGYKDIGEDEFWIRGHFPGQPLLPGTLMCEVAAQLASFFVGKFDLLGHPLVGLGGLKAVQLHRSAVPGQRLVVAIEQTRVRRGALIVCRFQGFIDRQLAIEGEIVGVPLPGA